MVGGRFSGFLFQFEMARFLLAAAALLLFLVPIQAQPAIGSASAVSAAKLPLSAKERHETFEEVWQTINEKYYDARFHGVDWNAVRKRYQARVAETDDEKDFYALLDRMVGELRDSHTRVYSPLQRQQQLKFRRTSAGIIVRKIEGKSVVASVALDSEAARAGIKAGMIVRRIDGQTIDKALAKAREEIGASSSEYALEMRAFSKIFAGEPETTLKLELIELGGKAFTVTLRRRTLASKPSVSARLLDSGVAYLRLSGFVETLENEIKQTLERFKDVPAMILDLRDNGGGDGEMGLRFAGNFFAREITVANLVTRTGKPPIPEMPMILHTGGKTKPVYSRPLAVLINEGTASTSELIAAAMQEQNRATIFGTRSCGCVLAFLDYKKLKSGGFLTMSEFGFVTAKKRTLEGNGVTPDKIVPPTVKDVADGRDAAIEQAERFLRNSRQSFK